MVDLAISSIDRHSSIDNDAGLVLCRMASIYHRMMRTSCIISFQRAKFFLSNFWILTLVSDCVTIHSLEVDVVDIVFSSHLDDFSS